MNLTAPGLTTTHWSVVLATHADDPARARAALEQLCTTYWYPLYAYLRRRGHQPADAEDLVQGFLAHLLERRFFQDADPHKGRTHHPRTPSRDAAKTRRQLRFPSQNRFEVLAEANSAGEMR